jgi:hypothetical protein
MSYLLSRFNKRNIHKLIALTDSFTWEELPMRHPHTGHTTKAGYIRKIPAVAKLVFTYSTACHAIQNTLRIAYSHAMILTKWYPFDATVSPAYELVNMSQVMLKINLLSFENHTYLQTDEYSRHMYYKLIWKIII